VVAGLKADEPESLDLTAIAFLVLQDLAFEYGLRLEDAIKKITA